MTKLEELNAARDSAYDALEAAYDANDEANEAYWVELSLKSKCDKYDVAVKELFSLLDATEETDEGRVHRPVQIVCVRSDMLIKLENVLATLKSTMDE
tara:strand:+ start:171 stop:464 length:294 start_codon:yes stop_codon:yes gene_type:complete